MISGGPGSGKSSFAKIFCAKLADEGIVKPVYIPLHLIDPTREVATEVEKFVRDEGLLGFNPLDSDRKEEKILLVFDGLDELASQGKVAAQVTRDFVLAVERMVERRNLGQQPILVLLSGRELVIQENETEFRRPRQVLCLLPYFTPKVDRSSFTDKKKILDKDLRNDWWKNYAELTGADFKSMPLQLNSIEIDEITAQPLLNYLVALSYSRGKLNFDKKLNLNSVYADLVAAVHDRGYENRRIFTPIRHITANDFSRVLEEIGLAAWHGSDGRSTSVRDIMDHCRLSGLESLLNTFKEGAQAGVTKLLAAFFFRRNGESTGEDAAFVFTHKSFGEYLTSLRITRGIERIATERIRRSKNPDDGFSISDALVHWGRLTGPAPVTSYIQKFLNRELEQRSAVEVESWSAVLTELASTVVENHMPVEKMGVASFSNSFRNDVNASIALLIALNACARVAASKVNLSLLSETSFGTFLRRVCPQRTGSASATLFSALSYLNLSGQCLDMVDLYGANLEQTNWSGAKVHFGSFGAAVISNANFQDAVLKWSRFDRGIQDSVNFESADLREVNFKGSVLRKSIFRKSDLMESNFLGANIQNCDFSGAIISGSTIHTCREISGCIFDLAVVTEDDVAIIERFEVQKKEGTVSGDLKIVSDVSMAEFCGGPVKYKTGK